MGHGALSCGMARAITPGRIKESPAMNAMLSWPARLLIAVVMLLLLSMHETKIQRSVAILETSITAMIVCMVTGVCVNQTRADFS